MDPNKTTKAPSKLDLFRFRKDSGYISSSPATSSTEGTVIRRSLSGAKDRLPSSKGSSSETSPEEATSPEFIGSVTPNFTVGETKMQRTLTHDSPQGAFQEEPTSPESNQFAHLSHSTSSSSTPPTNLNTNDRVLLAFKCRGSRMDWDRCIHPYCHTVRRQWEQFRRCCQDILNHCCPDCSKFKNMILSHSHTCSNRACPVVMCNETRNLCQAQKEQLAGNTRKASGLIRSQSFSERTPVSEYQGLPFWLSSSNFPAYNNANELSVRGIMGNSPVSMEMIEAKAAEIVERLDQEEPLIKSSAERPRSLSAHEGDRSQGLPGSALSPIVEIPGREDMTSLSPSEPYSFGDNNVSLILRSHNQYSSYSTAYSSFGDGPGSLGGLPSLGQQSSQPLSLSAQPASMVVEQQPAVPERVYPKQETVHKLDNINLIPGQDDYYHQHRDYYLNDVDCLGAGGFGTCMFGQDNTTLHQFAMKRNKEAMDSLRAECFVLSKLGMHDNVIRFLGAVIDEEDNNVLQPRVFKMFMELADCGNLAEMLVADHETGVKEPLYLDQSLYYIQQVLQGVNYLHQKGVLHLDIKAVNVLVFDQGRTVKLADFGTAVQLSEITAVGGRLTGFTPYFAAPEVVRQEQPTFSADVWGVMCVLVELLTTRWPGCHQGDAPIPFQQMMFFVGQYQDCDIEKMIPLSQMNLDPSIEQLFRWVFVADPSKRPSALTLLNHPRIMEAPEYARAFDYDGYDEEMSQETPDVQQATPIPGLTPSQAPQYTPTQVGAAVEQTPSQPPLLHSSQNYASMELEKDYPGRNKRESHDSGTGDDLDSSLTSRGFPTRSSTGGSSDRPVYRTLDSGVDTPAGTESWRSKFNNWPTDDHPFPVQGIENYEDYHSFPFTDSSHHETPFKRSSSITGTTYNSNHSDSCNPIPGSQLRKLVPSTHRLYHSYSAPIVGDHFARRRLSLQMSIDKTGEGRPRLRRTSSMVYVDKGPEIDSPEKEKRPSIEELISDVSGLKLDHTPSHSRQPERTEHVQEYVPTSSTMTRQLPGRMLCAHDPPNVPAATPTNQKPVTVYETIC